MENRIRRNWTAREDALLRRSVQKELDSKRPLLWRELAKHIPGRSNKDCRKRWWNSLAGSTAKGAWSPEEDKRLIEAVEKYGTDWIKVAGAVGTRCSDQCSGHWRHVLNPNINYCDWTPEEDERLLDAIRIYSTNWATIASFHTPQRTTLALKNQYWKLRQRSQNAGKTCPARPDCSASALSATETARATQMVNKKGQTPSGSSDDDDDDDDDEDDERVANRNDQSETEGLDVDVDMDSSQAAEYDQADPNCWLGDWPKPLALLTPSWTGYDAKTGRVMSGEPWMDGLADEGPDDPGPSGDSGATPLYPSEQYASAPCEGQVQLAQSAPDDDDAMYNYLAHLDDTFPQYSSDANLPLPALPVTAAPLPVSPVSLDPVLGTTSGDDKSPSATPPRKAQSETVDTLSHSVSIKFSCTTGQLSNIMSLLASTGLPVNMKIDTE